jgi:DNA-binding CsgD family transcriptional regulator
MDDPEPPEGVSLGWRADQPGSLEHREVGFLFLQEGDEMKRMKRRSLSPAQSNVLRTKTPKGTNRNPRPLWFNYSSGQPPVWMRLPTDANEQVARLLVAPETTAAIRSIGEDLFPRLTSFEAAVARKDWSSVSAWELVDAAYNHAGLHLGLQAFPRTEDVGLEPNPCGWLYVKLLLLGTLVALMGSHEARINDPKTLWALPDLRRDIARSVYLAVYYLLAGPLAGCEIERRGAQHMGFHVAMVLWHMRNLRSAGGEEEPSDSRTRRHIEVVLRASWRQTPRAIRLRLLQERTGEEGYWKPWLSTDFAGQAIETLVRRWGPYDDLERQARALMGEMDIAARAIRDGVVKQVKREYDRCKFEVLFQEPPETEDRTTLPWGPDAHPAQEPDPEAEMIFRDLLRLITTDPRFRRLLLALGEGARTQQEMAARYGLTDRTIQNYMRDLRRLVELATMEMDQTEGQIAARWGATVRTVRTSKARLRRLFKQ